MVAFSHVLGCQCLVFFSAQTALWAVFLIGSFFILKLITDEGEAPVRKSFGKGMKILKAKRREKNKRHPPIKRKVPVEYPCRLYLLQQQEAKAQATHQNRLIHGTV